MSRESESAAICSRLTTRDSPLNCYSRPFVQLIETAGRDGFIGRDAVKDLNKIAFFGANLKHPQLCNAIYNDECPGRLRCLVIVNGGFWNKNSGRATVTRNSGGREHSRTQSVVTILNRCLDNR